MKAKDIIIIQTPVSSKTFTQVTCLMDEDELSQAKLERPDLVFIRASEMPEAVNIPDPDKPSIRNLDNPLGITIRGMTLPADLEEQLEKLQEK